MLENVNPISLRNLRLNQRFPHLIGDIARLSRGVQAENVFNDRNFSGCGVKPAKRSPIVNN